MPDVNKEPVGGLAKIALDVLAAVGSIVKSSLPATVAIGIVQSLITEFFTSYNAGKLDPETVKKDLQTLLTTLSAHDKHYDQELEEKLKK